MKTNQMRTSQRYLLRACSIKKVSHHHVRLAETQRQADDGKVSWWEKEETSGMPDWGLLTWGSWRGV